MSQFIDKTRPRNLQRRARLEDSQNFYKQVCHDLNKVANITKWHNGKDKKRSADSLVSSKFVSSQQAKYATLDAKRRNIALLHQRSERLREKLANEMKQYEKELNEKGLTFETHF